MKSATLALCSAEWKQCKSNASLLEGFRFISLANQSGIVTPSKAAFPEPKLFNFAVPPETPPTQVPLVKVKCDLSVYLFWKILT